MPAGHQKEVDMSALTLFDFVAQNSEQLVNAIIEEGGYQGPKYTAIMDKGFQLNNGPKDIQKCRDYLDTQVKHKTRLMKEIQETLAVVPPPEPSTVGAK